jgi:hypothetical protein
MASRIMHMVSEAHYEADGLTVAYGAGELHEPGSLPDGVRYREVVADDALRATAPAHARPPEPPPAPEPKAPAAKAAKASGS